VSRQDRYHLCPQGQTPILRRVSKRRELSTVIGLTLSGKISKRHFEQALGAVEILKALQHFSGTSPAR
jgi:hypothetical protein